jgi:hypothetical protein
MYCIETKLVGETLFINPQSETAQLNLELRIGDQQELSEGFWHFQLSKIQKKTPITITVIGDELKIFMDDAGSLFIQQITDVVGSVAFQIGCLVITILDVTKMPKRFGSVNVWYLQEKKEYVAA